jgi:prepilin-type N-terminal cleavage/methylation domain-containing protein
MNATSSPLRRAQAPAFRSLPTAGFSLVELLGVIVLIGIISLGAYIYVGNASQQAIINTKARNAQMVNQLLSIAAATGVSIGADSKNQIDTTNTTTLLTALNNGVTAQNVNIPIKLTPPINLTSAGSYTINQSATIPTTYTFASDGLGTTQP